MHGYEEAEGRRRWTKVEESFVNLGLPLFKQKLHRASGKIRALFFPRWVVSSSWLRYSPIVILYIFHDFSSVWLRPRTTPPASDLEITWYLPSTAVIFQPVSFICPVDAKENRSLLGVGRARFCQIPNKSSRVFRQNIVSARLCKNQSCAACPSLFPPAPSEATGNFFSRHFNQKLTKHHWVLYTNFAQNSLV